MVSLLNDGQRGPPLDKPGATGTSLTEVQGELDRGLRFRAAEVFTEG